MGEPQKYRRGEPSRMAPIAVPFQALSPHPALSGIPLRGVREGYQLRRAYLLISAKRPKRLRLRGGAIGH